MYRDIALPSILYKYRFFDQNDYYISIIKEPSLWFASARTFGDPFDLTLGFDLSDNPVGITERWAKDYVKRKYTSKSRNERRKLVREKLKEIKNSKEHSDWFNNYIIETNFNKFGICSLTSKCDNQLMWDRYADRHKGYCVGFDIGMLQDFMVYLAAEKEILLDILIMSYENKIPKIIFFESTLSNNSKNDIIKLFSTKLDKWEYEDEYRLMLWHHVNQHLILPKEMIKSVYLGHCISLANQ